MMFLTKMFTIQISSLNYQFLKINYIYIYIYISWKKLEGCLQKGPFNEYKNWLQYNITKQLFKKRNNIKDQTLY